MAPNVNGQQYPYTPEGMAAAEQAASAPTTGATKLRVQGPDGPADLDLPDGIVEQIQDGLVQAGVADDQNLPQVTAAVLNSLLDPDYRQRLQVAIESGAEGFPPQLLPILEQLEGAAGGGPPQEPKPMPDMMRRAMGEQPPPSPEPSPLDRMLMRGGR